MKRFPAREPPLSSPHQTPADPFSRGGGGEPALAKREAPGRREGHSVRRVEFKLSLIYAVLLTVLAYAGTVNQGLLRRHADLAQRAYELADSIAELRTETASVRSPEAINSWAVGMGMIPTTEIENTSYIPPILAPASPPEATGLEVRMLWR